MSSLVVTTKTTCVHRTLGTSRKEKISQEFVLDTTAASKKCTWTKGSAPKAIQNPVHQQATAGHWEQARDLTNQPKAQPRRRSRRRRWAATSPSHRRAPLPSASHSDRPIACTQMASPSLFWKDPARLLRRPHRTKPPRRSRPRSWRHWSCLG